ncbi:hypothetical protein acsn021_18190 [Anaerocolumna cellulosilytica]|uniref:Uncharacterized protein n=1 Tax=Anaerocolumna cellulosilytica TaxID=433286 RepID=A0A6S6R4C3_9FIRM|nr:hypothetical protein [Anaerocolumna cellulosilytica]MBB5194787.1 hypothetical protein [Anaerocolumna cellulosilytica]BCJ94250.1 hypothetical protein acsn021_18190 [Anaerocolumna cellulosilytica]
MDYKKTSHTNVQKILPVSEPMITTYTHHAHLLSVLTHYRQAYPWIFSNYIHLFINKDYVNKWGDFYFPLPYEIRTPETCNWIETQKVNRHLVETKWDSVINFVKECIDTENYIHTMINYAYLPVSDRYKRSNTNHDIFIYGYDTDKKELYVSDFFKGGKYSHQMISFEDFTLAFSQYHQAVNNDYLRQVVYLYKFNNGCGYQFSIQNIVNSFRMYLSGQVPEYWDQYNNGNRQEIVFGTQIYETLKNYAVRLMKKEEPFDARAFYMLYDHKKLMALRLKYLKEQGYFITIHNDLNISKAEEMEIITRDMVNVLLKFRFNNNPRELDRVIKLLEETQKREYDILSQYI